MSEVYPNLFIGSLRDCFFEQRDDWAIVHACKSPCHQTALGYRGSLLPTHPNYLVYERGNHLFLNMIDPPFRPLFKPALFTASLDFIGKHISNRNVLVHCNLGLSRSPSIALLYLAKRTKAISGETYVKAAQDFAKLYPNYHPSSGIVFYLASNWSKFE